MQNRIRKTTLSCKLDNILFRQDYPKAINKIINLKNNIKCSNNSGDKCTLYEDGGGVHKGILRGTTGS